MRLYLKNHFKSLRLINKIVIIALSLIIVATISATGLLFYMQDYYYNRGISFGITAIRKQNTSIQSIHGNPIEIDIPSLNISVPVINGTYDSKTHNWTLTRSNAQYLTDTALPNNLSGNTFIYGHYRPEVFASLHRIQPDAEAIVKTSNGHTFYYMLATTFVTKPSDLSVLAPSVKPILTLQTCSGFEFQNRQMFIFNFEKVTAS
jgi:LPXTG-site transpeptidase (sortase) family protein